MRGFHLDEGDNGVEFADKPNVLHRSIDTP